MDGSNVVNHSALQQPVYSVLRFRPVCKSWLAVISEPKFVKTHLQYATKNMTLRRYMVLESEKLISIDYETHESELVSHLPITKGIENQEILGWCNGLLLVGVGEKAHILWNPLTRKGVSDFTLKSHFRDYQRLYGLCYDCSADAYKVVRVTRGFNHAYDKTCANFYNSKAKTLTKVEHFPYKLFNSAQGVLVNGNLHFVVVRNIQYNDGLPLGTIVDNIDTAGTRDYVLIYFDVVEDKFKELPKPDWLNHESCFNLGTIGGLLCLVQHYHGRPHMSMMWVMERYGVGDSWTPMRKIRIRSQKQQPLYPKKNGEIMFEIKDWEGYHHELVAYSRTNDGDTALEVLKYGNQTGFNSSPYIESMVSPLKAM